MAKTEKELLPPIHVLSDEEGKALFDKQARKYLGISGEEFLRRWDNGEFSEEELESSEVVRISMMIPFARSSQ